MNKFLNAIITIAARDFTKFIKDKNRIIAAFIFPAIFTGILGSANQANLGAAAGFDFLLFTFLGSMSNTMFTNTTQGIVSLLEDRDNDFAQEMFVAPISRLSIILGKITGETMIAVVMLITQFLLVFLLGIKFDFTKLIFMFPFLILIAILGGAMGLVMISLLKTQKAANQIFGLIIFPQFFLAGIFSPVKDLPLPLLVLSRIVPLTYAVDLIRNLYYFEYHNLVDLFSFQILPTVAAKPVLFPLALDLTVVLAYTIIFIAVGMTVFIRSEKNK